MRIGSLDLLPHEHRRWHLGEPIRCHRSGVCDRVEHRRGTDVDDCRWKTQNVLVEGNVFTLDRSTIPGPAPANGCGFNGLFSNSDTFPDWSPSQTEVVEEAITFGQNNVWRNNAYTGDWRFMVEELGNTVTCAAWRSSPDCQDLGSTLN